MKTLILFLALGLASLSVSAQGHVIRGGHIYSPPVIVHQYAPIYPYYGGWGFGLGLGWPYYPYYPSYPAYGYNRTSKLEMKIQDIKTDYKDRIWSARHSDSLDKQERKAEVHRLKTERDQAIQDLKLNYYKQPTKS